MAWIRSYGKSRLNDVSATRSVLQKVYLDVDDYLDLGFTITNNIENPIVIRNESLEGAAIEIH